MDKLAFLGLAAAIILPLTNIPLIIKLERRKSSRDLSLWWAGGVWVCLLLMLPSGLASSDTVFTVFTILNVILFTGVFIQVIRYRSG
jgi:hypothetical protein